MIERTTRFSASRSLECIEAGSAPSLKTNRAKNTRILHIGFHSGYDTSNTTCTFKRIHTFKSKIPLRPKVFSTIRIFVWGNMQFYFLTISKSTQKSDIEIVVFWLGWLGTGVCLIPYPFVKLTNRHRKSLNFLVNTIQNGGFSHGWLC